MSRPLLKFCTLTRVKGLVYKGCERVLKLPLKNFLDKKNSSENLEFNFFYLLFSAQLIPYVPLINEKTRIKE